MTSSQKNIIHPTIEIELPTPHPHQEIFVNWTEQYPEAQCLIAPCGTKLGKSFGCAIWLSTEALSYERLYCVWVGPTKLKCKIGYRYIKAMLLGIPGIQCVDSLLEIRFANGSFIQFLHGRDAETTIEGEAVDRFVIDESGKQKKQLWHSTFTTITQTMGKGIITGTPRGFGWYYDEFRKAKHGDPFYCWAQLETANSPFVNPKAIAQAKRLLPKSLFDQYYRAMFVSMSSTFGDLSNIWDDTHQFNSNCKFWIHPDESARNIETVTGWDIAKKRDYSVFYTVNLKGELVGYARFRQVSYERQVDRLRHYMHTYFNTKDGDRMLRYDATGVGSAVGDMIADKDIDASITAVTFSQKSKQEMVSRTTMAIDAGWHRAPRIEQIEHEFGNFEVKTSTSGMYRYSAPEGEHDDVVCAAMLAISGAYQSAAAEEAEDFLYKLQAGNSGDEDEDIIDYASDPDDDFFNDDENENEEDDDFDFNEE